MTIPRRGEDDELIIGALTRLWKWEPDPRLALDPHDILVVNDLEGCIACVDKSKRVFVDTRSKFYRLAELGDVLPLVTLLWHEGWHYANGPNEAGAYEGTLSFLRRTSIADLRPDLAAEVERACNQALARTGAG